MLYLRVKQALDDILQFLKANNVEVPNDLERALDALNKALKTGEPFAKEYLVMIDQWLFPDAGMGWFEDLKYELSEKKYHELCVLVSKLSRQIN